MPPVQQEIVGGKIIGGLVQRATEILGANSPRDCRDDSPRYFILHRQHILDLLIIVFRPEIVAADRVSQFGTDPNAASEFPDAARNHIPDAQLPADLADIDGSPL